MKKHKVYIAGPITGLPYDEAVRRFAAAEANNARVVKWELSLRELRIIERLDAQNNTNDNSTQVCGTTGAAHCNFDGGVQGGWHHAIEAG